MTHEAKNFGHEELLRIYELHSRLADNVSQRREGANKLHGSLLTGLALTLVVLLRLSDSNDNWTLNFVCIVIGLIGIVLSASWFLVIRSYQQLNSGKFKVLRELEDHLQFKFFEREWEYLGQGEDSKRYKKLTQMEARLPFLAGILFVIIMLYPLWNYLSSCAAQLL